MKLAEARHRRGLSQTKVAAAMGTSASIISRLENGADVRLSTLQKYAAVLNCDLVIRLVKTADQRKVVDVDDLRVCPTCGGWEDAKGQHYRIEDGESPQPIAKEHE